MGRAPDGFSASIATGDDSCVVSLSGELDMASAPELAHALLSLPDPGPAEVVVDFSDLSFVDSSGIAVLIEAQHRLAEGGQKGTRRLLPPEELRCLRRGRAVLVYGTLPPARSILTERLHHHGLGCARPARN